MQSHGINTWTGTDTHGLTGDITFTSFGAREEIEADEGTSSTIYSEWKFGDGVQLISYGKLKEKQSMWILAWITCSYFIQTSREFPPNLIEGTLTRLEKREAVELIYEVRLEKTILGSKELEGRLVGPISVYLGQGSRAAMPEPPPHAKVGDKHIWRVNMNDRGQIHIRDPLTANGEVRQILSRLSVGLTELKNSNFEKSRTELLALLKDHSSHYFYFPEPNGNDPLKPNNMTANDLKAILPYALAAIETLPFRNGNAELDLLIGDSSLPIDVRLICLHRWLVKLPRTSKLDGNPIPQHFLGLVKEGRSRSHGLASGEIFRLILDRKDVFREAPSLLAESARFGLSDQHSIEFRRGFVGGVYAWDLTRSELGRTSPVSDSFLTFLIEQLACEKDEQIESILLIKMAISTLQEEQLKTIEGSLTKFSPSAQAKIAKEIDLVRNPPTPKKRP